MSAEKGAFLKMYYSFITMSTCFLDFLLYLLIIDLKMWNKRCFFSPLKKDNCTNLQMISSNLLTPALHALKLTDLRVTFSLRINSRCI